MNTFEITFDPEKQFSSFIMDNLKPIKFPNDWDIKFRTDILITPFFQTMDFISHLGEEEHTSDWDPHLIITLNDDTQIITNPGYFEYGETKGKHLFITDSDWDTDEEIKHKIPIMDIKQLEVIR